MRRRVTRPVRLLGLLLAAGLALAAQPAMAQPPAPATDPRQIYSSESPDWLRAVGKLQVPSSTRADTIVTAWHCLEFYRDLSKPIVFTLLPGSRDSIASEAYRLADGGGMHADWAILRLYDAVPVSSVNPMTIHPEQADPGRPIIMAGYSRDRAVGNNGDHLSYDPDCAITHQSQRSSDSNCTAHKGSSGGAVTQVSPAGDPRICGVISQGNGVGLSTFVPINGFRHALTQHLR